MFHELLQLTDRAGMPPVAVIQSATRIGARAAGQEVDIGRIGPGKLANMVVLTKNPLSTIENLNTNVMTVERERVFVRGDFIPLQQGDITDF